jgi:hypothetical protein
MLWNLNDVARDSDKREEAAHIALENCLGNAEDNVWADVKKGAVRLNSCTATEFISHVHINFI